PTDSRRLADGLDGTAGLVDVAVHASPSGTRSPPAASGGRPHYAAARAPSRTPSRDRIASAARGVALGSPERPLAAFGEIGLTGELRYVAHPDRRIAEAKKFGLAPVVSPDGEARTLRAAVGVALGRPQQGSRAA
ncbi:MAG TPA: hypothetical protein VNT32_10800, partial [Thermoleophilaceae bacterium]|nr:hypothetical protein [Thermoleophilaceae bacterium]